jgi:hypothetical protein
MEFVRRTVQDGEEDAEKIGVTGKKKIPGLAAYRTVNEDAEDPVVNEVDDLGPPPEFHVRKILAGYGRADKYDNHPERNGKQVSHFISVQVQIALFSQSVQIPAALSPLM